MRPAALAAVLLLTAPPAAAYEVTVGFGGGYRTGAWTPVTVAGGNAAAGDTLHVWAEDPDGQFVRSPAGAAVTAADGRPAWRFLVRFGRPSGRLRIERLSGAGAAPVVEERRLPEPIPSTTRVLLAAGDLPAVGAAARVTAAEAAARPQVLPLAADGWSTAGVSARGYDAADAIVVCGREAAGLPADVVRGIDAWVRLGGRLVFIAGPSAVGLPPEVAAWLPAPVERLATLRRLGGLETYARSGRLPARVAAGIQVPLLADGGTMPGVVDVREGAGDAGPPLVVRRCHGLGTIAWLGIDVDTEPFRDWPGTVALLANLLGGRPEPSDTAAGDADGGDADLAGQLRTALERFTTAGGPPAVAPVAFEVVAAIGLLYVLCLYPLDWWIVSRAGGRPWVAWTSLAAFVTAFTGLVWGVHGARQPPGSLPPPAAEVVDIDAAGGLVRGRGWAATYAADNERLDVAVAVEPPAAAGVADLSRGPQDTLQGSLEHRLPFPLEDCRLVHAGWLYDVGRLEPGQRYDTAAGRGPRSLAAALTRRTAAKERDVAARWNPAAADAERILEVAGFHAAAGGPAYTRAAGGRLAGLDLSAVAGLDRAVLVGLAPRGQATWSFSGQPATARGLYRIVIPVASAADGGGR